MNALWNYLLKRVILKGAKLIFACRSVFSSPEPKAHGWASLRHPSAYRRPIRQHFQTSPLKPLGQLNSNFIWRLLRAQERKFVQMVLVTWPRWLPRPYMVLKFHMKTPNDKLPKCLQNSLVTWPRWLPHPDGKTL